MRAFHGAAFPTCRRDLRQNGVKRDFTKWKGVFRGQNVNPIKSASTPTNSSQRNHRDRFEIKGERRHAGKDGEEQLHEITCLLYSAVGTTNYGYEKRDERNATSSQDYIIQYEDGN
ncbi:hypothetical protein EYF80_042557 [Liparis tanakae]|uniref:Uncharacterized protein n=1 Tax=Liparis tanakae TaxID=230148 RepID=A0A4Z2G152_9TELE|nr:hypothetical protein EYF80_042557 [Liparis tanakae]